MYCVECYKKGEGHMEFKAHMTYQGDSLCSHHFKERISLEINPVTEVPVKNLYTDMIYRKEE
ncbi:hypothetical protein LCGC14_1267260 [marine sediment metagenome]|uniref:Uncharacterized protein n=1 Tax=marine sediment metagenome TaxID=412755 RepID=A0A0F9KZ78_9ZZZZ